MAQAFKIKFEGTLRRISVPLEGFGYDDLELKIRDLFQIPSTFRVVLTYTDGEDDVISMADNQDLKDACLMQKLNPLKLEVKRIPLQMEIEAKGNNFGLNTTEFNVEALLKGLFPESTAKAIDQVLSRYPPYLFTTIPAHVLPEALDTFLGTLAAAGNAENAETFPRGGGVIAPGIAVHKYIECDNCYVCPIVGPRYKSIKKHDYDLCSTCYKKVGNEIDYRKLDRPLIAASPNPETSFKGAHDKFSLSSVCRTRSSSRPLGQFSPKLDLKGIDRLLDAEFVMDVTILDGSNVEVDSTFTKVWRLKNCGARPWPQHTKLVHIGGTMRSSTGVVTLKLPEGGLPSESELDVSVELKAPETTGKYVANWRLMAPSGRMFGHSVWVLIEAVPVCNKSQTCESEGSHVEKELNEEAKICDFILNHTNGGEEGIMADLELGEVGLKTASMSSNLKEQGGETDGFSLVESLDNGHGEEFEATDEFELVGSLPHEFTSGVSGIKQHNANIEPRRNSFSEDDSLASAGWDHLVKELEELGLPSSEGSIKRAVKQLVELEKQTSGKIKAA